MDYLIWNNGNGSVLQNGVKLNLYAKPDVLGGVYDNVYYEPATDNLTKVINGKTYRLTVNEEGTIDEPAEIQAFIDAYSEPAPIHCVNSLGVYIGQN